MHDGEAVGALGHTVKLDSINFAEGVDAIYLAGGHGTCVDFVDNAVLKAAIETMYAADKVVAADCHGPVGLAQCTKPDGSPLVKVRGLCSAARHDLTCVPPVCQVCEFDLRSNQMQGLAVTGFSNSEEGAVQLTEAVPFREYGRRRPCHTAAWGARNSE
eukprot:COSAG01_NODE_12800_length_1683_cov_1.714646_2_plen_159_part_00